MANVSILLTPFTIDDILNWLIVLSDKPLLANLTTNRLHAQVLQAVIDGVSTDPEEDIQSTSNVFDVHGTDVRSVHLYVAALLEVPFSVHLAVNLIADHVGQWVDTERQEILHGLVCVSHIPF